MTEPKLIDISDYREARVGYGARREVALRYAEVTNLERDLDLVAFAKRGEPPGVWDRLHARLSGQINQRHRARR